MATISITKQELLKMLEAAKAKADKEDAKIAEKHRKDEAKALDQFRSDLRKAMREDYTGTKKKYSGYGNGVKIEPPTCPTLNSPPIQSAIRQIKADSRKDERMNLGDEHEWIKAAFWLPESERPKVSVCDGGV